MKTYITLIELPDCLKNTLFTNSHICGNYFQNGYIKGNRYEKQFVENNPHIFKQIKILDAITNIEMHP